MSNIRTKRSSAAIRFERLLPRLRSQSGQGILEYTLILIVVLGIVFVMAKPVIAKLQGRLTDNLKKGIFANDPTGANFYYFPLK
jgi:hypothetical protein